MNLLTEALNSLSKAVAITGTPYQAGTASSGDIAEWCRVCMLHSGRHSLDCWLPRAREVLRLAAESAGHLPAQPAREDDQKALRAAALEEAARLCDAVTERYAPGGKGSPIPTTWPEVASRMCAAEIRALAGSTAGEGREDNQELLGKKGGE